MAQESSSAHQEHALEQVEALAREADIQKAKQIANQLEMHLFPQASLDNPIATKEITESQIAVRNKLNTIFDASDEEYPLSPEIEDMLLAFLRALTAAIEKVEAQGFTQAKQESRATEPQATEPAQAKAEFTAEFQGAPDAEPEFEVGGQQEAAAAMPAGPEEERQRPAAKATTEKQFDYDELLDEMIPVNTEGGMKRVIANAIEDGFWNIANKRKKRPKDIRETLYPMLASFLRDQVKAEKPIPGVSTKQIQEIREEFENQGVNEYLNELQEEIDRLTTTNENLGEDVEDLKSQRTEIKTGGKGNQTPSLEAKESLTKQINTKREAIRTNKAAIKATTKKVEVAKKVAQNLRKKVDPKTLLTYVNHFFALMGSAAEKGGTKQEFKAVLVKATEFDKSFYQQAIERTNQQVERYKMEQVNQNIGFWQKIGRVEIGKKWLIDYIATSSVLEQFPENNREKASKLIQSLKNFDVDRADLQIELKEWLNSLKALLPPENKEEKLKNVVAGVIAQMETGIDGKKHREGIRTSNVEDIIILTTEVRKAYETRIADKEEDLEIFMRELDDFHKTIHEKAEEASPIMAKEVREFFSKNAWTRRLGRFLGRKAADKGKVLGAWGVEKGKQGMIATAKYGWEKAKENKGIFPLAAYGMYLGMTQSAVFAYVLWRVGKWGWKSKFGSKIKEKLKITKKEPIEATI